MPIHRRDVYIPPATHYLPSAGLLFRADLGVDQTIINLYGSSKRRISRKQRVHNCAAEARVHASVTPRAAVTSTLLRRNVQLTSLWRPREA